MRPWARGRSRSRSTAAGSRSDRRDPAALSRLRPQPACRGCLRSGACVAPCRRRPREDGRDEQHERCQRSARKGDHSEQERDDHEAREHVRGRPEPEPRALRRARRREDDDGSPAMAVAEVSGTPQPAYVVTSTPTTRTASVTTVRSPRLSPVDRLLSATEHRPADRRSHRRTPRSRMRDSRAPGSPHDRRHVHAVPAPHRRCGAGFLPRARRLGGAELDDRRCGLLSRSGGASSRTGGGMTSTGRCACCTTPCDTEPSRNDLNGERPRAPSR